MKKQNKNTRNNPSPSVVAFESALAYNPMIRAREIIPMMTQSDDPMGSYTGTFADNHDKTPIQDADDL